MELRFKKALSSLTRSARRIEADRNIPEDLKKAFLDVNRFLRAEIKKYDGAQKVLKNPYHRPGDLLARASAKRQTRETEALGRVLKRVMDENDRKKIPATGR